MKIVVLDGYALNPGDLSWDKIASQGELTVYDRTSADEVLGRVGDAEALFTNKTPVTEETIARAPKLRFIGVLATGYNIVDTEAAARHGVVVSNVPDYATDSVAQLTIALLLEMCHHAGEHSRAALAGEWAECADYCFWKYPLIELAGKTLGIIGLGRIGRAVARIALALGMRVLAYDPRQDAALETEALRYAPLDELWAISDVISLHCSLTPGNTGMINAAAISRMKPGAMLINTARGPLIAEHDLADALRRGHIAYAAVDVLSKEPPSAANPLLHAPNIIVTPHIAWAPKAARERLMHISAENLAAWMAGRPQNRV